MTLAEELTKIRNSSKFRMIYNVIKSSELFDEEYYLSSGEVDGAYPDALTHYIASKAAFTRDPSPYFSVSFYLNQNPDIREALLNPLFHYIQHGEMEGRSPNPFFSPSDYTELNPDLRNNWSQSLLRHYIALGRDEGRFYSTQLYSKSTSKLNDIDSYDKWIINNESNIYREVANNLRLFKRRPLISIIVPVYNPQKEWLIKCIESVIQQSYEHLQLCLADDLSTKTHVRDVLEHYTKTDNRICCVYRQSNGNISEASNSALEIAQGEWSLLLDHDDVLHEHALYHVVKAINDKPNIQLIYSDEDKIDHNESRTDPHFKCDWNPDLLYSQNYISHLGAYKTAIMKNIGGFRNGYEGSQDYDLLLRYLREIDPKAIHHIPKPLYHWRAIEGSTALASSEKSYTTKAGMRALQDHFTALKQHVVVEQGELDNTYKVNWLISDEPLVSLIIPTYNGHRITKQAIDSILHKTTYHNFEIILVDNNSDDPLSLDYFNSIANHKKVTVLRYPHPFNFSAINNFAVQHARGDIIGLINNDVEVINATWLTEMVSHAQRNEIGCVGAKLYYPNDTIQHAGVVLGIGGVAGHSHKYFNRDEYGYFSRLKMVQNVSAVTGACLLVRKSVFLQVRGLNEKDLAIAFNDVDLCLKIKKAGYRNLWTPYAELYHHESVSRGAENSPEKVNRFNSEMNYMKQVWANALLTDTCYSPNLTLEREDFSIRVNRNV